MPPVDLRPAAITIPALLLTPREAARALAISERKLWSMTQPRGPIPCVRFDRSVRYSRTALVELIAVETGTLAGQGERSVEFDRPDDVTRGGQAR
jgi:hypothetical protein